MDWLNKLGIKRSYEDIMGAQIPLFYKKKEYQKIEQHNIDDLNTSEELQQITKRISRIV